MIMITCKTILLAEHEIEYVIYKMLGSISRNMQYLLYIRF